MVTESRLHRPVSLASLAAFRIGFGLLLLVAALRYFTHGWIAEYFLEPAHFFKYWGFGWVRPWPGVGMYAHFALLVVCALGVALGYRYRWAVIGYGLLFGYAHLIDKTNFLNHYYLVLCVCALMACLPLAGMWSLDARRRPEQRRESVPAWMLWALRAQFGVVYVFGGVAKLSSDWLLRAQPLSLWLSRKSDWPLVGALLGKTETAFAMSWAGAAFDLCVVPLLLFGKTRPFAFLALCAFHAATSQLFSIGMFPFFMVCGATLFFRPEWPLSRLGSAPALGAAARQSAAAAESAPRWLLPALGLHFALQLGLPLRHWLYPGQQCWTEQGFRFSWNVMLMEKNGTVDFRVVDARTGRSLVVSPREYFTAYQVAMMSPQPDMVLEAANVIADDRKRWGARRPAVYADAFASLNGRPMQRLVDPKVDLAAQVDSLAPKPWILPMTPEPDPRIALLTRSSR
jgi:vitamin K-dependent gamma-carboxylase